MEEHKFINTIQMKTNITIFLGIVFLFFFPFMGKAADGPHWVCDVYAYELDMTLYASVNINGQPTNSENIEIAAFCGDECRGVAELMSVSGVNAVYYYMRIRSNKLAERITFKGYDKVGKKEIVLADALDFISQKQYGYPSNPFVLNSFINPEDVGNVTNTTEALHLSGEWGTSELQLLSQNIHDDEESATNSNLTTVDLTKVSFKEGTSLNNVFTNCEALTSVTLNDIPSGDNVNAFSGSNPNCLIFVSEGVIVPQTWMNVVKGSQADNIVLTDQRLFSAPRTIQATHVEYTRTFQKETDEAWNYGWEAICVPFDVQSIERKEGVVLQSKPVQRGRANVEFRLYELTSKGFVQANSLKSYTPSVIAISDVGKDKMDFVLSASDVVISASDKTYTVNGPTYDLIGTFQMVEPFSSVLAINEKGDAFIPAKKTINPFRAYVIPHKGVELSSVPIKEYIPVVGITLSRISLSLTVKESVTLSVTVLPENATNKDVSWSSDDETVVKVSTTGVVTGIGQGKATIKVQTKDGGSSAICQVEVLSTNPPTPPTGAVSVVGVVLNPDQYTLKIHESVQLTAIIQPADATNKEVLWSSSDEVVAKVNQEGKVTANSVGDAIIAVKTTDGNFIAKCYIHVVTPTAISRIEGEQVNVYPRIVSEYFMVTGLTKPARIEIMDYSGRTVKSLKVGNASECVIYGNLPPASYLVRVVQGKDINVFKILIIKR